MLPGEDTSSLSPNRTCQPEVSIPVRDLIEGLVQPVSTFGTQGKWKHIGNMVEEGKA